MRKKRNRVLRKQRILFSPFSFQRIRVQQFDALNYCFFSILFHQFRKIVLQKRERERERERNLSAVARDFNQAPRATSLDLSFLSPVGFVFLASSRTRTYIKKNFSERERENSKRFSTSFRTRVRRDSNFNSRKINKSSFARESREISER